MSSPFDRPFGPECHRADGAGVAAGRLSPFILTPQAQNWLPNQADMVAWPDYISAIADHI
jgi:hypothetical protein